MSAEAPTKSPILSIIDTENECLEALAAKVKEAIAEQKDVPQAIANFDNMVRSVNERRAALRPQLSTGGKA